VLVAGARKLPSFDEGVTFVRVENGRWIVGAFKADVTFGIVDGLARKNDPQPYVAVHGDLAAFTNGEGALNVTNLVTHAIVLKDAAACTGTSSLSSRFLWCDANPGGRVGHELRTGKEFSVGRSAFVSPDERYFVRVPGVGWDNDVISEDRVEWTSDTGRTVTLTKKVPRATANMEPMTSTVPVAFCGDGKLFAIVTKKELVVHRDRTVKLISASSADASVYSPRTSYMPFTASDGLVPRTSLMTRLSPSCRCVSPISTGTGASNIVAGGIVTSCITAHVESLFGACMSATFVSRSCKRASSFDVSVAHDASTRRTRYRIDQGWSFSIAASSIFRR
jgi:hypothetical protein